MRKALLLAVAFSLSSGAQAGEFYGVVSGVSKHFGSNSQNFRESHPGLGIEYKEGDVTYSAGFYRNSVDRNTVYAAVGWTPITIGPVHIGAQVGLATGYPGINNGRLGPMATGLIQVDVTENVGVNVVLIPYIPNNTPTVVGFQLKYKF